jgi:hypothetical protein
VVGAGPIALDAITPGFYTSLAHGSLLSTGPVFAAVSDGSDCFLPDTSTYCGGFSLSDSAGGPITAGGSFRTTAFSVNYPPGVIAGMIPEPESWALMLVGFGGLGVALRRRSATVVA